MEVIARPRRSGKTTFLIDYMRRSMATNYLLIVHNVQRRDHLRHEHPDLSSRIITAFEASFKGRGVNGEKYLIDEIDLCLPELVRHINIKAFTVSVPEESGWDN